MSHDERIAKLDEELAKKQKHRDHLLTIKTAEAEIPSVWDTGQVTQAQLAHQYGISQVTVRRILVDAGRPIVRVRKLSLEERAEVASLLQKGERIDHLAGLYHVSRNTIRRVGLSQGVLVKGVRRPRRSDEEYALVEAFDAEARARFGGAGLYNLGLGLKQWHYKQEHKARTEIRKQLDELATYTKDEAEDTGEQAIVTGIEDNTPVVERPPVAEPEATPPTVEWPPPSHFEESPFAAAEQEDTRSF